MNHLSPSRCSLSSWIRKRTCVPLGRNTVFTNAYQVIGVVLAILMASPLHAVVLPSSLPGNVLWLDASQITPQTNLTPLVTWDDNSTLGTNDASQGTDASRPFYVVDGGPQFNNLPVVRFDGNNDNLRIADNGSLEDTGAMTWFIVAQQGTTTAQKALITKWAHPTQNTYAVQSDGSNDYQVFIADSITDAGTRLGQTAGMPAGIRETAHLMTIEFDGSGASNSDRLSFLINATEPAFGYFGTIPSSLTDSTVEVVIGDFAAGADRPYNGDFAEIIMFNRVLSNGSINDFDSELNDVQYYLDQKYGLGLGLSATPLPPVVPEPSTFLLLGLAVIGLVRQDRRSRRRA